MKSKLFITGCFIWILLPASLLFAQAPYPPSPVISDIIWDSSIVRQATGSDTWPITWAEDDNLYTVYGDGWGFDPKVPNKLSLGFSKVIGMGSDFSGINIRSTTGEQTGDGASGKKASGMLMVDATLYMWVRNANNNGEQCQLAWSTDHAVTWTWNSWKFTEFGYCAFLNFGQNYAGARDSYVYMYSPNTTSAYNATDELILTRVLKSQIADRTAYEFFNGLDANGNSFWTTDINQRKAVFIFTAGVNRLDVTYNAPLKRYLMTMRRKVGSVNHFGIYDAPEPWGPWTTVFYTESWDVDPGESQHLPSKWISADGKTIYLVFSGSDSFSVRKATLTTSDFSSSSSVDPRPLMTAVKSGYVGGPITFSVVGEAKGKSYIKQNLQYIDQNTPAHFTVTLGDQLCYGSGCDDWSQYKVDTSWFSTKYPVWPVKGDQDTGYEGYYGLPTANYYFDYGPARFVFFDYRGFGGYPKTTDLLTNYDNSSTATLTQALQEAKSANKHVFIFTHTQYYSENCGTKSYANSPPSSLTDLFEQNNVRIVFQGDNPGYSNIVRNGVYYLRPSGAIITSCTPQLFITNIAVVGGSITLQMKYLDGTTFDTINISTAETDTSPPNPPTGLMVK